MRTLFLHKFARPYRCKIKVLANISRLRISVQEMESLLNISSAISSRKIKSREKDSFSEAKSSLSSIFAFNKIWSKASS